MRFHWLLPDVAGVPVLMYHRVWPGLSDGLTLRPEQLREQWLWLRDHGYNVVTLQQFLDAAAGRVALPDKPVLLTFDDGYRNNLDHVYPLAQELGFPFTIFIIACTLDGIAYNEPADLDKKLSLAELQQLDPRLVQLALHGYEHENFKETSLEVLKRAMLQSFAAFERSGLPYVKALAYPYGGRPKDAVQLRELKTWMQEQGMKGAFRIGNRPQSLPAKDLFELRRIDIRGGDSLDDFKIKLRKGKLKPF